MPANYGDGLGIEQNCRYIYRAKVRLLILTLTLDINSRVLQNPAGRNRAYLHMPHL
jgi:hypothetical protein